MITSAMLARQTILPHSSNPANSFGPILLQTPCRSEKSQVLCNQANPHSFDKTAGVGVPAFVIRCTEAQKCRFLSPLAATLTHSLFRKSFACHSYENTRDGVPLRSRPPTTHCPLPTFCRPFVFIFLRIAFPATPLFSQPSALPRGVGYNSGQFQFGKALASMPGTSFSAFL